MLAPLNTSTPPYLDASILTRWVYTPPRLHFPTPQYHHTHIWAYTLTRLHSSKPQCLHVTRRHKRLHTYTPTCQLSYICDSILRKLSNICERKVEEKGWPNRKASRRQRLAKGKGWPKRRDSQRERLTKIQPALLDSCITMLPLGLYRPARNQSTLIPTPAWSTDFQLLLCLSG